MRSNNVGIALCALVAGFVAGAPVLAQEVTLRGVTSMPDNSYYTKRFLAWVERFNAEGKGVARIQFIGGTAAVPAFEQGNAIKTGIVDLGLVASPYFTNLLPEADILKLSQRTAKEMRENGTFEYLNKVFTTKANIYYLASAVDYTPFHLYLTKKIDKPDLSGLKLRTTPAYRDFFQALGATLVTTPPGEMYTALERGVVDGYGWPVHQIFDLGLEKITKFRVDPGFYYADLPVLINWDAYRKLTPPQREFVNKQARRMETELEEWKAYNAEDVKRQAQAGIQTIQFTGADAKRYLDKAYEVGWAEALKRSPEHAPALRKLISK